MGVAAGAAGDLALVRRVLLEELRGIPARVLLFGSWARGDARPTSDIDVGLLAASPVAAETLASIRERLEESGVVRRVDVVDLALAPPALRRQAELEGVEWAS